MLDDKSKFLLQILIKNSTGSYFILSEQEILSVSKQNCHFAEGEISKIIIALNQRGYVKVKYNDGRLFCLLVTEKGFNYENSQDKIVNLESANFSAVGWCVFGSFIGAFFGAVLTAVLVLIIL